jgi:uncharacterized protein YdeI (BOF family)
MDNSKNYVNTTFEQLTALTSRGSEKHFTFDDGTGTLPVKIAAKLFPENQPVSAQTRVEISGEFEKKMFGQPKFDVKEIRLLP